MRVNSLSGTAECDQDELLELQRLAMLGATSAMAVHEFNNLMTPVLARAQFALDEDDVPLMKKALERTVIQTQQAVGICRHLLNVAKPDGPQPPTCSLAEVLREAVATLARPLEKDGIELTVSVDESLRVKAEPMVVHQVLFNLLLNARTAMKEARGRLRVSAEREGNEILISVSDSGRGISDEVLESSINPFLAADDGVRPHDWLNVGLGLAFCRRVIHEHGGSISACANEGPGCTFHLRWPAA